ncbi:MAG: desulfoferrodoxin family protein [Methylococcaceae bacterium]
MERRDFIGLSVAGLGASMVSSKLAAAETGKRNMAGGVYYTKENPGRWSKKIAGHLPTLDVKRKGKKTTIEVVTAHGMDGYKHYIVKHVLLDQGYNFLDENMFDPMKDKIPASSFELKAYKGTVYVLSMCNKHDVWMNSITV